MTSALDNSSFEALAVEIENSLQETSAFLSAYLNCSAPKLLVSAYERVNQLHKILQVASFPGVQDLNYEMLCVLESLKSQETPSELQLNTLCQSIIILPRYVANYLKLVGNEPQLLLPYINSLRASQVKPLLSERHYSGFSASLAMSMPGQFTPGVTVEKLGYIRRMYIWGLLDYLKNNHSQEQTAHLKMMKRALLQLHQLHSEEFWLLALAYIECIETGRLSLDIGRKRLLSDIDKQIQALSGSQFLNVPEGLKQDLLYLIYLADSQTPYAFEVAQKYQLVRPEKDDAYYQEEHASLYNPDVSTVNLLIDEIKESINEQKAICLSLQMGAIAEPIKDALKSSANRAASLLTACGVEDLARQSLKEFDVLNDKAHAVDQQVIERYSTHLLEVEQSLNVLSTLPGKTKIDQRLINVDLSLLNVSDELHINPTNSVIQECEHDLEDIMALIDKFVDTKYDVACLNEALPILERVKTCLMFIHQRTGSELIDDLWVFINRATMRQFSQGEINAWLQKLADALVLIEQYLMLLRKDQDVSNILGLAKKAMSKLYEHNSGLIREKSSL